jgi:hypothetical protein
VAQERSGGIETEETEMGALLIGKGLEDLSELRDMLAAFFEARAEAIARAGPNSG